MATGTITFFNISKGFGLIAPDLGGPAVFALSADIIGAKKLVKRQRVSFDVRQSTDGAFAQGIRVLA
jgi:cold shock CspA family protein